MLEQAAGRIAALAGGALVDRGGDGLEVDLGCGARAVMRVTQELRADPVAAGPKFQLHLDIHTPGVRDAAWLDRWATVWQELPFSGLELGRFAVQLPLTTSVSGTLATSSPLAGRAVLVTGHFLSGLPHMVDCLAQMGAPTDAMTVLGKDYSYRLRHRVAGTLRERGMSVASCDQAQQAVAEHSERAARRGLRALALDDGGYVAPLLAGHLRAQAPLWDGVVEQTMSGIFRLEPIRDALCFPIFPVAQSQAKGRLEMYWIADKAVSTALDLAAPLKIEGQAALVLGYGHLGRQVAGTLKDRRMRVAVYDTDILRLIEAHEHGYLTSRDLPTLLSRHAPLIVFGATGRTSLTREHFAALPRDAFLASVTSRDTEFDLPALQAMATPGPSHDGVSLSFRLPTSVAVVVLADGRPVNFHETDSIGSLNSDLVRAAMLVGAHAVARDGARHAPGPDPAWADQALAKSGLLEDYYQRYGPTIPRADTGRAVTLA
ncbi:NAD(P)-dependent oxidoreductase [Streptomyces goshikiensis]|uniref:NAD(P)-dependent oxidoreductase n=1 Tax=Streptomyces goshikiensis TaxID=1942 RepID=UPI003684E286